MHNVSPFALEIENVVMRHRMTSALAWHLHAWNIARKKAENKGRDGNLVQYITVHVCACAGETDLERAADNAGVNR